MIKLEKSIIGQAYYKYQRMGPYIRVHTSQEGHIAPDLKFAFLKADEKTQAEWRVKRDRGTTIHGYIAGYLKGEQIDIVDEWAKEPMERFQKWCSGNYILQKVKAVESVVVSDDLGLGGRIDAWAGSVLVDWKYAKDVYPEYLVQLALYAAIINDESVTRLEVVHIPTEEGKSITSMGTSSINSYLRRGLLTFERWKQENEEKLRWASAPQELLEKRAKARGKNRAAIEHREEYIWPWLYEDSLKCLQERGER